MNSPSLLAAASLGVGEYVAGVAVLLALVLGWFILQDCLMSLREAWAKGKLKCSIVSVRALLMLLGIWVAVCVGFYYAKPHLQTLLGALNNAIASAISPTDSAGK